MKVYIVLTERESGLIQSGYLSKEGTSFKTPFLLVEREFAEDFVNYVAEANKAVRGLNFGFYKRIAIYFEE